MFVVHSPSSSPPCFRSCSSFLGQPGMHMRCVWKVVEGLNGVTSPERNRCSSGGCIAFHLGQWKLVCPVPGDVSDIYPDLHSGVLRGLQFCLPSTVSRPESCVASYPVSCCRLFVFLDSLWYYTCLSSVLSLFMLSCWTHRIVDTDSWGVWCTGHVCKSGREVYVCCVEEGIPEVWINESHQD